MYFDVQEICSVQEYIEQWHQHRASIFIGVAVTAILYWCFPPFRRITESAGHYKVIKQSDCQTSSISTKPHPKRILGKKRVSSQNGKKSNRNFFQPDQNEDLDSDIQVCIFYTSLTGSTAQYAQQLKTDLFSHIQGIYPTLSISTPAHFLSPGVPLSRTFLPPLIFNLGDIELDEYFLSLPKMLEEGIKAKYIYLIITPSYESNSPTASFLDYLRETHHDFRIDSAPLSSLGGFSVFGFGDSSEWPESDGKFCQEAIQVDKYLAKLTGGSGSRRMFPLGIGDVNPASSRASKTSGTALDSFLEWRIYLQDAIKEYIETGMLECQHKLRNAVGSGDEDSDVGCDAAQESKYDMDLEDLGSMIDRSSDFLKKSNATYGPTPAVVDFTTQVGKLALRGQTTIRNEMVPKDGITHKALTKQGYSIIGSHSGVKICRWTKSALRGRGSCYKFSFYGIKSHLCMETTPSLACSNKCVFCWRHGTNPVGTAWRWRVDPPEEIFKGVVEGHYRKIKMLKGVPGVRADRFSEAFRIRHCALSLVGEPIFYPYINEFLALLHDSRISSFLVCNAQHPAQLRALAPVTQLYVSIDASNKESLKRIDRPLHRDFWERLQECLNILREKRHKQRTVFRLTLVKGFNMEDEVKGYADLIDRGLPGFVEVKGVTYCGNSGDGEARLTMGNVPFYHEVVQFVEALDAELARRGLEYGIGAEHEHSCCILVASKRFYINGQWHTLINYDRFFELLKEGREFRPEEYVGEATPKWANWGNGGFDPSDERVYRRGKGPGGQQKAFLTESAKKIE
ncbi:radical SAM superfamily-domain-containing protein [Trichophaea hybrida]|nr:radical SAM superfamily-domain-containing protein [Trichophaea hybrida]